MALLPPCGQKWKSAVSLHTSICVILLYLRLSCDVMAASSSSSSPPYRLLYAFMQHLQRGWTTGQVQGRFSLHSWRSCWMFEPAALKYFTLWWMLFFSTLKIYWVVHQKDLFQLSHSDCRFLADDGYDKQIVNFSFVSLKIKMMTFAGGQQ